MNAEQVPMTKEYKDKHFCEWTYADFEEGFETGCGEIFCFTADGIKENNFNFCPHCGRVITESVNTESYIYTSIEEPPFTDPSPVTEAEDTARMEAHQAGGGLA